MCRRASIVVPPVIEPVVGCDAAASRRFYGELFGWSIRVDQSMDYGIVAANPDTPTGGIGQAGAGSRFGVGLVIYFPVDDVDASLELAEKLGGTRVVDPWEIAGLGRMAVFADLDGNNEHAAGISQLCHFSPANSPARDTAQGSEPSGASASTVVARSVLAARRSKSAS